MTLGCVEDYSIEEIGDRKINWKISRQEALSD
jgi:hypothetical protein